MATSSRSNRQRSRAIPPDHLPRLTIQIVVILVAVCWIYWPARHGGWISDDLPNILQNPLLPDPAGLEKIWFEPTHHIEFYPIEETVHWMQWQSWGNATLGYHLTNIALHAINALLVWLLLHRLGLRWAWLGGLIFAVHPMQVESVAWMSELKNVLSLAPFLLTMFCWVSYEEQGRNRDYFAALAFFLTAMLCKISMAPFPVIILLYAWWKRDRIGLKDLRASAPFFIISVTLGLGTQIAGEAFHARYVPVLDPVPMGGIASRLACAGLAAAFYLKQCLWPVGLLPIYPQWQINPPSLVQFLPWPLFAGLFGYSWACRETWGRHLILGLGFFLLMLAPFLGLNAISYMSFTRVMDHFLYLPSIGIIGLLAAGISQVDAKLTPTFHRGLIAVLPIGIICLAVGSHEYAAIYRDQKTLSTYVIEHNPGAWTAENNLGNALDKENHQSEAIVHFQKALQIKPDYAMARYNLANALLRTEHYSEAALQYQRVIARYPNYPMAHNDLAVTLFHLGRLDEAISQMETELALYPDEPGVRQNLETLQAIAQRGGVKSSP